jgi:hypothetical protein
MADSLSKLEVRARAIATVARQLEPMAGLAEADRLGLKVCAEILGDALDKLAEHKKLSAAQSEHLKEPAKTLLAEADKLQQSPSPSQVAEWTRNLEPAAHAFLRAIHDLPHR